MRIDDAPNRTPQLVEALLNIWERSVCSTHAFLGEADIARIRAYVPQAIAGVEHLAVAYAEDGRPLGFAGVNGKALEMLFVDADVRGTGVGSTLLHRVVDIWHAQELEVNEQNPQAVGFYEHMGFVAFDRRETDDRGEPYPLLRLRLEA